jgi:hypothetical protein
MQVFQRMISTDLNGPAYNFVFRRKAPGHRPADNEHIKRVDLFIASLPDSLFLRLLLCHNLFSSSWERGIYLAVIVVGQITGITIAAGCARAEHRDRHR